MNKGLCPNENSTPKRTRAVYGGHNMLKYNAENAKENLSILTVFK